MVHSTLDLGVVNLGIFLDLVAVSLVTEILLLKTVNLGVNCKIEEPFDVGVEVLVLKLIEFE